MKTLLLLSSTLALTLLAAASGCNSEHPGDLHGETFSQPGETTAIGQLAQAQGAAGAKADSMLYDRHFTGDQLNALGQAKMDLILKGSPLNAPVKVYFVMAHDAVWTRETAVAEYLDKAGVTASDAVFAEGANPDNKTPAVYNLAGIYQVTKDSYSGQAADGPGAAK